MKEKARTPLRALPETVTETFREDGGRREDGERAPAAKGDTTVGKRPPKLSNPVGDAHRESISDTELVSDSRVCECTLCIEVRPVFMRERVPFCCASPDVSKSSPVNIRQCQYHDKNLLEKDRSESQGMLS